MANQFSDCKNITELDNAYEAVTSPENLSCDGEATQGEINARLSRIRKDYDMQFVIINKPPVTFTF